VSWIYDEAKQYSFDELILLPRRVDWNVFDLYHAPHFTLPFGIPIPTVVTIHDLIHIEHPESFYYPFVARHLIKSAVRRASAVLAVSNATKHAVEALTGVTSNYISVVPNAMPAFLHGDDVALGMTAQVREAVTKSPYFVAVLSNLKPHKGAADLLVAYQQARREFLSTTPDRLFPNLLLAGYGARDILHDNNLHSLAQEIEGVSVLGAVSAGDLKQLYSTAQALVVPSLAEGFCLPALEAQSVGTRVVCRPVPALQELVTSHDLLAADLSRHSLAEVLKQAASHPATSKAIDQERLNRFSLARVSEQLCRVYSDVVAQHAYKDMHQRGVA
jgi:glycosyltransferase involved in cell wall biosynthesis